MKSAIGEETNTFGFRAKNNDGQRLYPTAASIASATHSFRLLPADAAAIVAFS